MTNTIDQVRYAERREGLLVQLEAKFGPLPPSAKDRVEGMTPEELRQAAIDILKAEALRDLGLDE